MKGLRTVFSSLPTLEGYVVPIRLSNLVIMKLDLQVCCAGAYFKTPIEKFSSPYIFVLGYRSPKLQLDFRANDLGIVFKDVKFAPLESCFSITAVGPSHTVEVNRWFFILRSCENDQHFLGDVGWIHLTIL